MATGIPNAFYSLIERIRTNSVMAPLLKLTFMVGLFALATTWSSNPNIIIGLWGLFAICVIFSMLAYVGWSIKEPDRLRTESYRLEHHRLKQLIGDERDPNNAKIIEGERASNTHLEPVK
jgi:hypothetical protein